MSKPRNSKIPNHPVEVSGEYNFSMQNSARWVFPVRSFFTKYVEFAYLFSCKTELISRQVTSFILLFLIAS